MNSPTGRGKPKLTPADPGSAERLAMSGLEWEFENVLRAARPPLPPHIRQYRFALPRQWRFDVAWPDLMIAIELDGGTWSGGSHVRGKGYEDGCEKANAAVLRGWRLLRFTTAMVGDNRALETLEELLISSP